MCRIFGFRSVLQSQVHRSLVSADNALMHQSNRHPDGWGVAYYQGGAPHVIKSMSTAVDDHLFRRVSGVVSSETVVAHLRKATQGEMTIINTHPFQFGQWVFVHNGNVENFPQLRQKLVERIPPVLRRFILGDTDSEVLFYLLLARMAERCELSRAGFPLDDVIIAARKMVEEVEALTGGIHEDNAGPPDRTYLTFVLTNGTTMLAHQGGKELQYSTYKKSCPERDQCPSFAPECEAPTRSGFVNHLVLSSEPLQGHNVWHPMKPRQMVGVDWRMQIREEAA